VSAREELSVVLREHRYDRVRAVCECSDEVQVGLNCDAETHEQHAASIILAAGYSKPRTITTAEELDALGWKATVLDANGCVWVNDGDTLDEWASLSERNLQGGPIWRGSADIALPATVLHEGEAK